MPRPVTILPAPNVTRLGRSISDQGLATTHPLSDPILRFSVTTGPGTEMGRKVAIVLYGVAMAAVIVGVDLVFFRNRFWERLAANIGIVFVFAAFYLRFLRRP